MDQIQRFLFEKHHVRGEIVQLKDSYQKVLDAQEYPESVKQLLGEMLVAASLLVETIKIEGEISLQIQGKGAVNYVIVDANHRQEMRGVARWNADPQEQTFEELFKGGIFTITITPVQGERYQGIVAIEGATVASALEGYFTQSEQLPTKIEIRVDTQSQLAGGLFLQVLPSSSESSVDKDNNEFHHLTTLAETLRTEELTQLDKQDVLHRLFHEEEVTVFEANDVCFKCTCSKEKSAAALRSIDKAELLGIVEEQGSIRMNCQFCHAEYSYDAMDVEAIHSGFSGEQSQIQ